MFVRVVGAAVLRAVRVVSDGRCWVPCPTPDLLMSTRVGTNRICKDIMESWTQPARSATSRLNPAARTILSVRTEGDFAPDS